ncbi:ribonuclease III [Cryomorphaceae bacterium 1068]|nr:ribonuclease III [Cryomorphaceae bacterium 1068]
MDFRSIFSRSKSTREKEIIHLLVNSFGVRPKKISYYCQAFCHKSAARNIHNDRKLSNERLEFLGDAIIDSVVAEYLYRAHPSAEEGEMTKMKSRIVSRINLNKTAVEMGIHLLIETDLQATNSRESISGNAFEAVVGAIYLDRGYAKAKISVLNVLKRYANLGRIQNMENDFKSRLYEEAHRLGAKVYFKTIPVTSEKGAHQFLSKVIWNNDELGNGKGSSKKRAEQKASEQALIKISEIAD